MATLSLQFATITSTGFDVYMLVDEMAGEVQSMPEISVYTRVDINGNPTNKVAKVPADVTGQTVVPWVGPSYKATFTFAELGNDAANYIANGECLDTEFNRIYAPAIQYTFKPDLRCIMLDIVYTDSTASVAKPVQGQATRIQCRVKNEGNIKEFGGFNVNIKVDGVSIGNMAFGDIGAGFYDTKYLNWTAQGGADRVVTATIDSANAVKESNETNNTTTLTRRCYNPPSCTVAYTNKNAGGFDVEVTPTNGWSGVVNAVNVKSYAIALGTPDAKTIAAVYNSSTGKYVARVNRTEHSGIFGSYEVDVEVKDNAGINAWKYGTTSITQPAITSVLPAQIYKSTTAYILYGTFDEICWFDVADMAGNKIADFTVTSAPSSSQRQLSLPANTLTEGQSYMARVFIKYADLTEEVVAARGFDVAKLPSGSIAYANRTEEGFDVVVTATDGWPGTVNRVTILANTDLNGIDDRTTVEAVKNVGTGKWEARVHRSEHNGEFGAYTITAQIRDSHGCLKEVYGGTSMTKPNMTSILPAAVIPSTTDYIIYGNAFETGFTFEVVDSLGAHVADFTPDTDPRTAYSAPLTLPASTLTEATTYTVKLKSASGEVFDTRELICAKVSTGTIAYAGRNEEGFDVIVTPINGWPGEVNRVTILAQTDLNGTDDQTTVEAVLQEDGKWKARVHRSEHNGEFGNFTITAQVRDSYGCFKEVYGGTSMTKPALSSILPTVIIPSTTSFIAYGAALEAGFKYDILDETQAVIASFGMGATQDGNHQDLTLPASTLPEGKTYTMRLSSATNEVFDSETFICAKVPTGTIAYANKNNTGFDVIVTPVNGWPGTINRVTITSNTDLNGNDDSISIDAVLQEDGKYLARVNRAEHKNEFGNYTIGAMFRDTHGCAKEIYGGTTLTAPVITQVLPALILPETVEFTVYGTAFETGFTFELQDITGTKVADFGITSLTGGMAVLSLPAYTMEAATLYKVVMKSALAEKFSERNIPCAELPSGTILVDNMTCTGFDVTVTPINGWPGYVNRVNLKAWSDANGQDEMTSVDLTLEGDGKYHGRVIRSQHNGEFGSYSLWATVYDDFGASKGLPSGIIMQAPTTTSINPTTPTAATTEIAVRGTEMDSDMVYALYSADGTVKLCDLPVNSVTEEETFVSLPSNHGMVQGAFYRVCMMAADTLEVLGFQWVRFNEYFITKMITPMNQSGELLQAPYPTGVVIHCTDDLGATAHAENSYLSNNQVSANAHIFLDYNYIVQNVEFENVAWHAGYTANHRLLGVELCEFHDADKFPGIWDRAVWMFAHLLKFRIGATEATVDTAPAHDDVRLWWGETTHTDPIEFFAAHSLTVADFRAAVTAKMATITEIDLYPPTV